MKTIHHLGLVVACEIKTDYGTKAELLLFTLYDNFYCILVKKLENL